MHQRPVPCCHCSLEICVSAASHDDVLQGVGTDGTQLCEDYEAQVTSREKKPTDHLKNWEVGHLRVAANSF